MLFELLIQFGFEFLPVSIHAGFCAKESREEGTARESER